MVDTSFDCRWVREPRYKRVILTAWAYSRVTMRPDRNAQIREVAEGVRAEARERPQLEEEFDGLRKSEMVKKNLGYVLLKATK